MPRHGFLLSRHDTDHWCRVLHIDLPALTRRQRRRRYRRRIGLLFAVLLVLLALLALFVAHDFS